MLSNAERQASARSGSKMMHGGYTDARALFPLERAQLNALIDTLIPAEDGWPPAAELTLAELVSRYLTPDEHELSLYPHFRAGEFFRMLETEAGILAQMRQEDRTAAVARFEARSPELFGRVRDFVYYAYYGHPDVVELIRLRTRYGRDFHGRPQPIGYDAVLENWGGRVFPTSGTYFATDSVLRAPQARRVDA